MCCLHLGPDIPWERTLVTPHLFPNPSSCSELAAELCERPQLSLYDRDVLLRVSRAAVWNQTQLRASRFSSIPGSPSAWTPSVDSGALKSFIQNCRRQSCSQNLPACHSLIPSRFYHPNLQSSALGCGSHLMNVSSFANPTPPFHHEYLIPTTHTGTNTHTPLHHDQQASTYLSRQGHSFGHNFGCHVKGISFPAEEMPILWFLVEEPKHRAG